MADNKSDVAGAPPETLEKLPESPETQKRLTMCKYLYSKTVSKALLVFLGYLVAYMQWSVLLLLIALGSLAWLENRDQSKSQRIKQRAAACSNTKQDLSKKIDDIPAWVMFPDRERAEWLNQIIAQLWPTMKNYVVKVFRGKIQAKIRKKHESFRFEDIDLGCYPPQIDGVKVYNCSRTKDSIIIDFDVFYDGNCDINFSLSGAQIGGIHDFQLSVEVRVVLKPLLAKTPLIGGIQVFFLNTPDINFTLDGISGIPGFSSLIRSKIEQRLTKLIVFPNKVTKRFSKSVEVSELKALEPEGVLRVHVSEAKDLEGKDITGKSDPYAVLYVGAQECRTHYINQTLQPKWDYWCEFVILDPMSQHLGFKLYDHDNVNEDDFLGSGDVDISTIIKGETDQWLKLDNAKHGKLHLRFTWLSLSSNYSALNAASEEMKLLKVAKISTALLIVYVDSAQNLPTVKPFKKPHPYFNAIVCNRKQKSKTKKHTVDPAWEQGFVFLVTDPEIDSLYITIEDKESGSTLDQFAYRIKNLTHEPDLQISKTEFSLPRDEEGSKIVLSMQLRILTNDLFVNEDESESDSDDTFSRQGSSRSNKSAASFKTHSPNPTTPDFIEEEVRRASVFPDSAAVPLLRRSESVLSAGEHRLGRIELTLAYSDLRQKFLITVHRISNLPLKVPTDVPDPYVKLKLASVGTSIKHKTKTIADSCDPVFEETFEYLLSRQEVHEQRLELTVKTVKKMFFNNNFLGQVFINLKYIIVTEPHRAWYDLCPEEFD